VRRLSVQLRVNGVEPVSLSLDDYYKCREQTPRDEEGKLDFEAIEALDLGLLHEQLVDLLAGKKVHIPRFDFVTGKPTEKSTWQPCQIKPGQVLLIEGIHGLNPQLTAPVPDTAKLRIFVSALTQLVIDEHNRIFTADSRLLRRVVRDRRYRGTSAADTIDRWPSVRRGEEKHIFPYQELSDVMFNSALVYETPVLRTFALRYLLEVPREHPSRSHAYQLLKFLELFVPVFPDLVPANSILREFVGGSGFTY
jgi:uridine kinase